MREPVKIAEGKNSDGTPATKVYVFFEEGAYSLEQEDFNMNKRRVGAGIYPTVAKATKAYNRGEEKWGPWQ